ncbi:flagellar biosynthesis protein FlhA [Planococcus sp. CP5-4]|uniref:flagellar biosynthesis protein FlhA n=1 Tax=unclassified Planococcus (in: firmicutes) TaxID=2662419 RepID=UPI001C246EC1|nr:MULTISPECIES: flagellar biosynthesis protein FlhA [unclassified Planococcus (in: firmicutes)]MBU9672586.1 flagellar biosynthesis protein FlhA [Planococcus sp. CP5-4_YE]MBV0909636.1 flagellar biosynthesis protein FlhA [Planococcus sp. CP5-4_UN]MBW6064366.1 flagellar biosynthesis protein FlhA [Planococcus sp. CP5-4]
MKFRDYAILVSVIMIVIMMVIPLPPLLLDILIMINISLALTIILVAMNTQEPLQFSIFPTLLLLTTLFRLGLNVSTTRSILTNQTGGQVIETFGSFVVGGSAIIGILVFLILVIIQFLVITKGSERVAEVAARFTLDSMPGKQMSIDADLGAGMISDREAKTRREKVGQEADFYGAMDGASKFVKGDAIAGIIITIINIIGGLMIGVVVHGLPIGEAAQLFTLLSIGDGLVSQIPALLISTAMGIVVTRAVSDGNLGSDITRQLFAFPKMLYVVAGTLMMLAVFTPISPLLIMPVAGVIAFSAFRMQKTLNAEEAVEKDSDPGEKEAADLKSPESVTDLLHVDAIEFEFGYGLIPIADKNQGGDLLDRVIMIRRQCAMELGIVVPVIRIRDNIQLQPNEYVIKIKGNRVARGDIMLDHYLAMSPGVDDENVYGIETVEPAFGMPALWVDEDMKEEAEMAGYAIVDPPSVVSTHLTEIIKRHAHELVGRQEVKSLIENIRDSSPAVVEELIPNLMSIGEVQKVLMKLLKEKVSIRNLLVVLETLADYAPQTKDIDLLTEYVRQALARQITRQYAPDNEALKVITAGASLEKKFADSVHRTEQGNYLSIDPESSQTIFQKITEQAGQLQQNGVQPILLTSPAIRIYMRQFVERFAPDLPVLSYNELEPEIEIQSVGVVNIP